MPEIAELTTEPPGKREPLYMSCQSRSTSRGSRPTSQVSKSWIDPLGRVVGTAGVRLADADDPLVGLHLEEEQVAPADSDEIGVDLRDLHPASAFGSLATARPSASTKWSTSAALIGVERPASPSFEMITPSSSRLRWSSRNRSGGDAFRTVER